jgi:hypothetical protein
MKTFLAIMICVGVSLAASITAADAAGGCGIGLHRNAYGHCVRNWADPGAHACARGWHMGPGDHCIANWAHPAAHACARGWHLNGNDRCVRNW